MIREFFQQLFRRERDPVAKFPDTFPPGALALLARQRFDPGAERGYDIMSGGFRWLDEFPDHDRWWKLMREHDCWAFRFVLGYRASLVRGRERPELRKAWDQLRQHCPDWPGFRPERCSHDLQADLRAADRQSRRECIKLQREERIAQGDGKSE